MDYVDEILSSINGLEDEDDDDVISGLVEVGALTEVGAAKIRAAMRGKAKNLKAVMARMGVGGNLPSPNFAMSARDTLRRSPLGFTEDGTGAKFFTLAAAIGAQSVMRAKVSRVAHVNRLLIVPSGTGVIVMSLTVGDIEQLLAPGVPVELYGTDALTDSLPDNFDPLGPGLDLAITLQNTTAVAKTGTIGTKSAVKR